jgi:recombination protein RecT
MANQSNGIERVAAKAAPMTLKAFLDSPGARGKLAEVASRYMRPDDLVRLTLMAASRQPEILKCSHHSILRALMDAAAMGIAPGGTMGRGYLVPRKNRSTQELEACFDPGWRGLCDIARRSGQVKKIDAKVVYAADLFEYEEGTTQTLKHIPTLDAEDRGEIVAAYAIAKFADGEMQIEVLTRKDIEKIKGTSMAKGGPWASWFDEMARKSAVRRLCKYLPYDPMLERALEHATDTESGIRTTIDPNAIAEQPRAKSLAESIRARTHGHSEPPPATEDTAPAAADDGGPPPDWQPTDEREPGVD